MYGLTLVSYLNEEKLDEALKFKENEDIVNDAIDVVTPDNEDEDDNFVNADKVEAGKSSISR